MLEIKNLKRTFGQEVAVDSVEFSINDATITALIGQHQETEKTTLLNLISGHLEPDEGEIIFDGENIIPLNPCQRKKLGLSCVAREDYLFDNLTIADHVLAVARNSTSTVNELYAQWRMDSQFLRKSFTALAGAGIDVPMDTKINELSPIKKKLFTLGLAMLEPFKLLVWEEPLKGIDSDAYKEITKIILELKRNHKIVFFTCDEIEFAEQIAEQILVMDTGKIHTYKAQL